MKKTFFSALVAITLIATTSLAQSQVPYKKAKLRDYSQDAPRDILERKMNMVSYAQIETGMDKYISCYVGMNVERKMKFGWVKLLYGFPSKDKAIELSGRHLFSYMSTLKSNMSNFTLNYVDSSSTWRNIAYFSSNGEMVQIALELICDTTTNELQYSWLNDNGERCDTITFYSIDRPYNYGKKFPNLKLKLLNGDSISTKDLLGKTVVINWWAIHCSPCIAEMPGLNTLVDSNKNNPNIVFLAIANSPKDKVEGFLNKHEFKYIQALANKEVVALFDERYPRHLIVDSLGIITYSQAGGYAEIYNKIDLELRRTLGETIILGPKRLPKQNVILPSKSDEKEDIK
jgi:thiol-disulfide isomerase/thioredoxin